MKNIRYMTQGTCSRAINIILDDDNVIQEIKVEGGCSGNLQGIAHLVKGMPVDEVIERLDGIRCGSKSTSCPAQLANALKEYKNSK